MPSLPFLRSALVAAAMMAIVAPPAPAADYAGPYLAARLATTQNDYAAARAYYDRLLLATPEDRNVQEGALVTHIALDDQDQVAALTKIMLAEKPPSQIAALTGLAEAAKADDFAGGLAILDQGGDGGELVSGLFRAWALVGEGQMAEAGKAFDTLGATQGLAGFAAYHKALSLAMVGDYEGAEKIFSGNMAQVLHGTRRSILAHVQILSQLERDEDALKLLDDAFGPGLDPELAGVRASLAKGEAVPFTIVRTASEGVAETFFTVAQALNAEGPTAMALVHARLALLVRPDFGDAVLLTAAILEGQEQYDLAIAAYAQVKPDSPVYPATELGRAEALVAADRGDEAIGVLEKLAQAHPDLGSVWLALGDNYRRAERYADAVTAYDKAIALIGEPGPRDWFVYFARGISEHKSDQWDKAEKDFREALTLSPDQPSVLNYLGYSYVERRQDLDEALDMIKRAVAARPDAGYIIDSLGWAYYMLGRYDEAVTEMEKAVALEPTEPLLNDHLGDVYWAVGRKREAEFQWHRALSLGPGEDLDMDRVRRKLDVGLDAVLREEGAPALHPVHAAD
ncbi:tetratricopeptide repeat protein [Paenirhodobacter populi]|nr:tetratricopeptide repeat protein [Sinirhodobacter populi]